MVQDPWRGSGVLAREPVAQVSEGAKDRFQGPSAVPLFSAFHVHRPHCPVLLWVTPSHLLPGTLLLCCSPAPTPVHTPYNLPFQPGDSMAVRVSRVVCDSETYHCTRFQALPSPQKALHPLQSHRFSPPQPFLSLDLLHPDIFFFPMTPCPPGPPMQWLVSACPSSLRLSDCPVLFIRLPADNSGLLLPLPHGQ